MPKLKTKSGVKKRFRLTGTGKVRMNQSGKQHGMIKRTKSYAGLLTSDNGLIVELVTGENFQITITQS